MRADFIPRDIVEYSLLVLYDIQMIICENPDILAQFKRFHDFNLIS